MKPGTRFDSYEILGALGVGGMGEVYRARDTKLGREVAVKILPATFAGEPLYLQRFQREAQLLATLNHQNVAHVYDFGNADGVHYIVQELVPGRTLLEELREGSLTLERAVDVARQVAAGLEAAHARDIVHRDLKPSNVMVTPDGIAKILDFGLAKPVVPAEEGAEPLSEDTPTVHSVPRADVILGTGAYMPPEQARGLEVDERADIWAFGCLLYYALVGNKPFDGETLLDTLAAVVRASPDWDLLPPRTPRKIRDLLRRCLRKRVEDRLQHIGDARIVLDEVAHELAEGVDDADGGPAATVVTKGNPWWVAAAAALAGFALGAAGWALLGRPGPGAPLRTEVNLEAAESFVLEPAASFAIAHGNVLIYAGRTGETQRLYRRSLGSFEEVPIAGTEGGSNPFLSPDGEWIAFFSLDGKLKKVAANGGTPMVICDVRTANTGGTWLTDGTIVYGTAFTGSGLMRVSADGGEPELFTRPDEARQELEHGWPRRVPGTEIVLFSGVRSQGSHLMAFDVATNEVRPALQATGDARYMEPGYLVYAEAGNLVAVAFDAETLEVSGPPVVVVEGVRTTTGQRNRAFFEVDAGTLAYMPGRNDEVQERLVWVDREGNVEPLDFEPGDYGHPSLSPDGTRLAVDVSGASGTHATVIDLERGTRLRLTSEGNSVMPVWSPDGDRLAFAWTRGGPAEIHTRPADGSGEATPLLIREHALWPRSWSAGGLAYYELTVSSSGRDIWVLDPSDPDTEPRPLVATSFNERSPALSPDGSRLAFVSDESGRDEIYLRRLGASGGQITISPDGGREPVWSADGRELFYRSGDRFFVVTIGEGRRQIGAPQLLFEGNFATDETAHNQYYDVAPDGRRFLMITRNEAIEREDHLHVIRDWQAEMENRMKEAN